MSRNNKASKHPVDIDRENLFHQLKLDKSRIHMIDKSEKLIDFLNKMDQLSSKPGEEGVVFVGVDSEWKPTCVGGVGAENTNKVALIQIATETDVYLIDTMTIEFGSTYAKEFSTRFFANKRIVKLGYGFSHDIRVILQSLGCQNDADAFRHTVLDLAYLVNQVSFFTLLLFFISL